jgi:hypothetical protein
MTSLTTQEMQQRVGMRPTLLVGLGGTGQKVLVQLKARFIRNYGQVPPAVEFLCFDTDQAAEQTQIEGQIVRLTGETELVNIGGVQTANIVTNLEKYPAIASWITEDKERIPKGAITMGAKQVRPLGRLSLYWYVEKIYNKIFTSVQRLTDIKQGFERRGINVFVVSSVCGGTGSGILLDVAYLARNAIEKAGINPDFCYLNGFLALPSVFPTVDKTGIESNAYACLRELDYFMEAEWEVDYGNPRVPQFSVSERRPFNIVYLVDARNEQGQGLSGLDEIAPMLAEAIYLQVSSQVGDANNSAFDNVDVLASRVLNHDENRDAPTAYSSLGTASLVFPVTKIIEFCANRLGRDLISQHILKKNVVASRVDAAVNSFLQSNQVDIEMLLQQVSRDAKNNIMKIALDPRQLDRFKEGEVFGTTQAYLTKAENTVDNDFSLLLDMNRKVMTEKLTIAIQTDMNRALDDPSGGLYFVLAFLEKLDAKLVTTRADLDKGRAENDQRRDRSQATLQQTQAAFAQSFRSNAIGRGGRIKEARNRHVEMFQSYLIARFESRKREMAIAMLASLSTTIQASRAAVQRTIDRLQFVQGQFDQFVEKHGEGKSRTDFILAQDITTDEDIKQYYQHYFGNLGETPATGLLDVKSKGPLHTWLGYDQEALGGRILDYANSVFEPLRSEITIESIILQKKEQLDPRRRLIDLINRSVPFWMYKTAGVLGQDWAGEKKIVVIGVPDQGKSIYKDATEKEQQLTSTFDPFELTILQTKHGIPLFALTQYKDFKSSHDFVLSKRIKPLYIFPEVRPGGEKARQIFALGIAYGFIFKSGVYYHIIPANARDLPIQLDQGMADSLSTFRNNETWINHVSKQVEDQISREGVDTARQTLEQFVMEAYVYELKGGAAKINIDRTIMSQDTSVGKPGSVNFDLVREMQDSLDDYLKKVLRA